MVWWLVLYVVVVLGVVVAWSLVLYGVVVLMMKLQDVVCMPIHEWCVCASMIHP